MVQRCDADNTQAIDQSSFWDSSSNSLNWDAHRIGWTIAGACALATVLITFISVFRHTRNYHKPAEQKQILRILYMPPVYAIISFLSYRFFRVYTYYELIEVVYEAITISAFLMLLIEYVGATASGGKAEHALKRKDKRKLIFPFCCWRYRPTKAYFMYTLKWSVLQYVIIRPSVSVAGIICEHYGVLCESGSFSDYRYANVYLQCIDFISISIALYGLLLFYGLTKEELEGKRPLAKFLTIKLIVFFTFYQSFVFSALEGHVIHGTQYWTSTNIADGLSALAICIEMVFFAIAMLWAYPSKEYTVPGVKTSVWRGLVDSVDYRDFAKEIWTSIKFFFGRKRAASEEVGQRKNYEKAFGFGDGHGNELGSSSSEYPLQDGFGNGGSSSRRGSPQTLPSPPVHPARRTSYENRRAV